MQRDVQEQADSQRKIGVKDSAQAVPGLRRWIFCWRIGMESGDVFNRMRLRAARIENLEARVAQLHNMRQGVPCPDTHKRRRGRGLLLKVVHVCAEQHFEALSRVWQGVQDSAKPDAHQDVFKGVRIRPFGRRQQAELQGSYLPRCRGWEEGF